MFDLNEGKEILYYNPQADRLFIWHEATFLQLPCLEREDGVKMILDHPNEILEIEELPNMNSYRLVNVGDL